MKVLKYLFLSEGGKGHFWIVDGDVEQKNEMSLKYSSPKVNHKQGGGQREKSWTSSPQPPTSTGPQTGEGISSTEVSMSKWKSILPKPDIQNGWPSKIAMPITPTTTAMVDIQHTGITQ